MKIDKLLTKYTDAINAGERPDKEEYLKECPPRDRKELSELMNMIDVLNKYYAS